MGPFLQRAQAKKKKQPLTLHIPDDVTVGLCCSCRTPLPLSQLAPSRRLTIATDEFAKFAASVAESSSSVATLHRNVLADAERHSVHSLFVCRTCDRVINNSRKTRYRASVHPLHAVVSYLGNACTSSTANPKGPLFRQLLCNLLTRVRLANGTVYGNEIMTTGIAPPPVRILEQWAHEGRFAPDKSPQDREHAIVAAYMLSNGCAKWHIGADTVKMRRLRAFTRHLAVGMSFEAE